MYVQQGLEEAIENLQQAIVNCAEATAERHWMLARTHCLNSARL